jgi:KUP system potassium uptake protein
MTKQNRAAPPTAATAAAGLAALGVVYGDLGTSPLYTMQTIMGALGGSASTATALGVLSLIVWTLLITVSLKYCFFVMRADNQGEGGILALMSLVGFNDWKRGAYIGAAMGLLGAALIYGDGIITPAISVLSALEGVNVVTSVLKPFILPIAVVILIGLFAAQRFGTEKIGKAFGPVMLVWFVVIGVLGVMGVARHPTVLQALNPVFGIRLIVSSGPIALALLGGVFLCATGGEALYADMGHFGRFPIRLAWYGVALPALLLSYAGQAGAIIDGVPKGVNPFFALAPAWSVLPLVGLATLATIIASQAIITGAFSMTRQAMQLGWLPGFEIRQTSVRVHGQIYVPAVNDLMALGTVLITLSFRTADNLAGAYGTAVSTTMVLTTFLLIRAMGKVWRWPIWAVAPLAVLFLIVDVGFFVANLAKILDGGWIPLTLGVLIFLVMVTWRAGVRDVRAKLGDLAEPVGPFLAELKADHIPRVPGLAVFLTRPTDKIPALITEYVRNMGSLHRSVIALHIKFENQPRAPADERCKIEEISDNFWHVTLRYGFTEVPDLEDALDRVVGLPQDLDFSKAVYFTTRDTIGQHRHAGLKKIRLSLFAFLLRNSARVTDRFNLPASRTVEVTRQVLI